MAVESLLVLFLVDVFTRLYYPLNITKIIYISERNVSHFLEIEGNEGSFPLHHCYSIVYENELKQQLHRIPKKLGSAILILTIHVATFKPVSVPRNYGDDELMYV